MSGAIPSGKPSAEPDFFADFLAHAAPEGEHYEVVLSGTEVFEFRRLKGAPEIQKVADAVALFVEAWDGGRPPAKLKEFVGLDIEANTIAYLDECHTRRWRLRMEIEPKTDDAGEPILDGDGEPVMVEVEKRDELARFGKAEWIRLSQSWGAGFKAMRDAINYLAGVRVNIHETAAFNAASKP